MSEDMITPESSVTQTVPERKRREEVAYFDQIPESPSDQYTYARSAQIDDPTATDIKQLKNDLRNWALTRIGEIAAGNASICPGMQQHLSDLATCSEALSDLTRSIAETAESYIAVEEEGHQDQPTCKHVDAEVMNGVYTVLGEEWLSNAPSQATFVSQYGNARIQQIEHLREAATYPHDLIQHLHERKSEILDHIEENIRDHVVTVCHDLVAEKISLDRPDFFAPDHVPNDLKKELFVYDFIHTVRTKDQIRWVGYDFEEDQIDLDTIQTELVAHLIAESKLPPVSDEDQPIVELDSSLADYDRRQRLIEQTIAQMDQKIEGIDLLQEEMKQLKKLLQLEQSMKSSDKKIQPITLFLAEQECIILGQQTDDLLTDSEWSTFFTAMQQEAEEEAHAESEMDVPKFEGMRTLDTLVTDIMNTWFLMDTRRMTYAEETVSTRIDEPLQSEERCSAHHIPHSLAPYAQESPYSLRPSVIHPQ